MGAQRNGRRMIGQNEQTVIDCVLVQPAGQRSQQPAVEILNGRDLFGQTARVSGLVGRLRVYKYKVHPLPGQGIEGGKRFALPIGVQRAVGVGHVQPFQPHTACNPPHKRYAAGRSTAQSGARREIGQHRGRPTAPEPDRVCRQFALRLALKVDRMRVQHLARRVVQAFEVIVLGLAGAQIAPQQSVG